MTLSFPRSLSLPRALTFAAAAALALAWSGEIAPQNASGYFSRAEAIIGRPLTPMSYAGVARRTTARVGAVAVGTAAVVAATPNCVTTYNAYGQPVTVCN